MFFTTYCIPHIVQHIRFMTLQSLTGVLHSSCNSFHGQDESVFQPGRILACGIKHHQLGGWFARFHNLLGQMGSHLHVVAGVADALQGVCLTHVECGDIRIAESEPLPQVGISFEKILVSSDLMQTAGKQEISELRCRNGGMILS